ncbi:hypothetical protein KIN20_021028 [Parelaphostrongylus tenuis]|uniref:Uncharacterized protein n=1 Tax=Parelaphostrongylus tenuis TaxID=148309 RepID=A0AAD5MS34_PARTN|nr:hypothetical protein KIN20_021028 [Parelaphostrongylus tenuis]
MEIRNSCVLQKYNLATIRRTIQLEALTEEELNILSVVTKLEEVLSESQEPLSNNDNNLPIFRDNEILLV